MYQTANPPKVYRLFQDAVRAAKIEAEATGEKRYIHHGIAGFVVLAYATPATVRVEEPARKMSRR